MIWNGTIGNGDEQSPGHSKMDNPLSLDFLGMRYSQIANNMLAGTAHPDEDSPRKPCHLTGRRRLEGFPMPAEPDFDDAVAANALVDAAGNGFYLRQFRHRSIVGDLPPDAERG